MNFSEAMFYENCLTSYFHTNAVISRRVCLLVKMASKTVIRPILQGGLMNFVKNRNRHSGLKNFKIITATFIVESLGFISFALTIAWL